MKKLPKILIATGIYPPLIGGIAPYSFNLADALKRKGANVIVATYTVEHRLPSGIRHLVFFFKALFLMPRVDYVLALDTISTGLPALCAARIFGKKFILRLGGDFLWESYVNRTEKDVLLSRFYSPLPALSSKERMIFRLTLFLLHSADMIVFSTEWQRDIFSAPYRLETGRLYVIENYYGKREKENSSRGINFLWAGRSIPLKNLTRMKEAFRDAQAHTPWLTLEMITDGDALSQEKLFEKIKTSYAVILPSVSDVSPNLILEGISFGKPFILTSETGLREKLRGCGLFVDPLSVGDIKEKILLLCNEGVYRRCQERIRGFLYTHSWDDIADEFLTLFQRT